MSHCMRHLEEPDVAACQHCGRPFCAQCLVFPRGPKKPPYCIGCALNASGVRNSNVVRVKPTKASASTTRRLERAQRKLNREAAKHPVEAPVSEASRSSSVPAPTHISLPSERYGVSSHHSSDRQVS
ncbi:MAG: hypothetical protein KDA95_02195 [Acidimicrobiales bacterium]|nr:hypothetical protein [Acidimicrobiales bacterium]